MLSPKPDDEGEKLTGDERLEAKRRDEEARVWISGIEAVKAKIGVKAIYDLSATPFFLRGSGYPEGTLFPWVVSDFSLIDAIEAGNDLVTESGCGVSVPAENPDAVAEAVRRLMGTSPEERAALGSRGKQYVLKNHDYQVLAKSFLDVLQDGEGAEASSPDQFEVTSAA